MRGDSRRSLFLLLCLCTGFGFFFSGCYTVHQAIRDTKEGKPNAQPKAMNRLVRYITRTMGQSRDADVRLKAIRALGEIRRPASINTLRLVLQQESLLSHKRAAILALASLSASQALQELREALKESNPEVRMAAAAALGRLGIKDALRDLLRALRDKDPNVRAAAVRALVALEPKAALPRLMTALLDSSPKVQRAANNSLLEMGSKAFPILSVNLKKGSPRLQNAILTLLPGFGEKAYPLLLSAFVERPTRTSAQAALEDLSKDKIAWKELRRLMEEKDDEKEHKALFRKLQKLEKSYVLHGVTGVWERFSPRKRLWAIEPMGRLAAALNDQGQQLLLKTIRTTEDVSLQCFSLIALGYTGKSAIPLLKPYLKRARRPLMKAAIRGVAKLGMDGWEQMNGFLAHVDEDIRVTAILAAGPIRNSVVSRALMAQIKHPAAKIRMAVAKALGTQEDRSAIPELRNMLKDPVSTVVLSAIQALIQLGDEQNINLYIAALKYGPYPPEPGYVRTLGKLGNAKTVPLLKGLLRRYLREHARYLRKASALYKQRWRGRKPGAKESQIEEDVRISLVKEPARNPTAICSFFEALQALNRLGDSASTFLQQRGYQHNQRLNPLLTPPTACPWPPSLKKIR